MTPPATHAVAPPAARTSPPAARTSPPASRGTPVPGALSNPPLVGGSENQGRVNVATSAPFASPVLSSEQRLIELATLDQHHVKGCTRCNLCQTRKQTVFGEGAADAPLMFIGEGPGAKEDLSGRPFVGPAGELLNRMIEAMGFRREGVYIANVVKCRAFVPGPPPKDRAPAQDEVAACSPYLEKQVELIRPRVIVTLGVPATQHVLQTKQSMSRVRGTWSSWHGINVMPTWHPSYLLRREKEGDVTPKREAWADLQKVMSELGISAKKGE